MTAETAPFEGIDAGLELVDVRAGYGSLEVLRSVALDVPAGQLLAVLGPSGCGKSTLLRTIAGFELLREGTISVTGRRVADAHTSVAPERRRVGLVPQEGALFPHLDVGRNVGFGLSRRFGSRAERAARVKAMLELVDLGGYERRSPSALSGGQQQRVALARALAPGPSLVLLDEPFAALDAGLRQQVRREAAAVLRAAGTTAVLVTHDQDEALTMGDLVAVMLDGMIAQVGAPSELYRTPISLAVARFVGGTVVLSGRRRGATVDTPLGTLALHGVLPVGGEVVVVVRPEQIVEASVGVQVVVRDLVFHGADTVLQAETGGVEITARLAGTSELRVGDRVTLAVTGPVVAFDRNDGA
jgi:iron(III) transport system ATP-binding protein